MLAKAYELAKAGNPRAAGEECKLEFERGRDFVTAVEGLDFFVVAGAPREALEFAEDVERRLRFYRARLEFFRGLAFWDQGEHSKSRDSLRAALALGYDNRQRFQMELEKRLHANELDELLKSSKES